MSADRIARIYAKAVFELADGGGASPRVAEELKALSKAAGDVPNFYRALLDEKVPFGKRRDTAGEICRTAGIGNLTASLFKLLVERKLLQLLPMIAQDFIRRLNKKEGIISVHVRVASGSLAKEVKEGVRSSLERRLGKKVECDVAVEPGLVDGFVLKMGDFVYDASVKGKFKQMKEELMMA